MPGPARLLIESDTVTIPREEDVMPRKSPYGDRLREIDVFSFGSLELDPAGFSVTVNGDDIDLTFAEFLILKEFVSHPYQVLDRERLAGLIRGGVGDSGSIRPSLRSVDTHVARIRAKLRTAGYNCIRTMRYVGYRSVPPAHTSEQVKDTMRTAGQAGIASAKP